MIEEVIRGTLLFFIPSEVGAIRAVLSRTPALNLSIKKFQTSVINIFTNYSVLGKYVSNQD